MEISQQEAADYILYQVGALRAFCEAAEINPVALVGNEKVLMTADAVKQVEGMFA